MPPADGNLHRSSSRALIWPPAGLDYPAALVGEIVRSKIVRDPSWVAASTPPANWGIGHYSPKFGYDLAVSGSLWMPKYVTVADIGNSAALADCPPPHGQGAAAALNGNGPVLLSQYEGAPGDVAWCHWSGILNGWTFDLSTYDVGPGVTTLIVTKVVGPTSYIAYAADLAFPDVRPGPHSDVASVLVVGLCGAPTGPNGETQAAHGGTMSALLGDQT